MRYILLLAALLTVQVGNALEVDELLSKAEAGDGASQYLLGLAYAEGVIGIEKNRELSERWHSQALRTLEGNQANLNPKEQIYLANMYISELGGADKNYSKALNLIIRSAEKGHARSQTQLVQIYLGSNLAARDIDKAKFWAFKIIKNEKELAKDAAEKMFMGHFLPLAWRIDNGSDFERIIQPLGFALTLNPAYAIGALITAKNVIDLQSLDCGTSQLPDPYVEALMWFLLAKNLGSDYGKYLKKIKQPLTSSQILEGERMAQLCIDSNYEICGYEKKPGSIDYQIKSDIFDNANRWVVSECRFKDKIIQRKLKNDKGYIQYDFNAETRVREIEELFDGTRKETRIFQEGVIAERFTAEFDRERHRTFSAEGEVLSDTITDAKSKQRTNFNADGTVASRVSFKVIPEKVKKRIGNWKPNFNFEKHKEVSYFPDGSVSSIVTFMPIDPHRLLSGYDQHFRSKELYSDKAVLSKKILYKNGRPHREERYRDDGSLRRIKRL